MTANLQMDQKGIIQQCPSCGQQNRLPYRQLGNQTRCGKCKTSLAPIHEPVELTSAEEFQWLTGNSSLPVLVDFWAPWCPPCRAVAPELEKVAANGPGKWIIAKVNTEELPEATGQFQIGGIPTMILFQNGTEKSRISGARPAREIERFISESSQS